MEEKSLITKAFDLFDEMFIGNRLHPSPVTLSRHAYFFKTYIPINYHKTSKYLFVGFNDESESRIFISLKWNFEEYAEMLKNLNVPNAIDIVLQIKRWIEG